MINISISKGDIHRYRLRYDRDPSPGLLLTGELSGTGNEPEDAERLLTYAVPGDSRVTVKGSIRTVRLVIV